MPQKHKINKGTKIHGNYKYDGRKSHFTSVTEEGGKPKRVRTAVTHFIVDSSRPGHRASVHFDLERGLATASKGVPEEAVHELIRKLDVGVDDSRRVLDQLHTRAIPFTMTPGDPYTVPKALAGHITPPKRPKRRSGAGKQV